MSSRIDIAASPKRPVPPLTPPKAKRARQTSRIPARSAEVTPAAIDSDGASQDLIESIEGSVDGAAPRTGTSPGANAEEPSRKIEQGNLVFDPSDSSLGLDKRFAKPIKGEKPLELLTKKLGSIQQPYSTHHLKAGAVYRKLAALEFHNAVSFFHTIKVVLHDEVLQIQTSDKTWESRFDENVSPCVDEANTALALKEMTKAGVPLTKYWTWNSAGWDIVSPYIMASIIAVSAADNAVLRKVLGKDQQVYMMDKNAGKWAINSSYGEKNAAAFKFTANRTTQAYEIAKDIWRDYRKEVERIWREKMSAHILERARILANSPLGYFGSEPSPIERFNLRSVMRRHGFWQ